jgi:hypothetical protein
VSQADELFATLLDPNGVLRRSATLADPEPAILVFAQGRDARLDVEALRATAERYFDTTVGLTVPKRYTAPFPERDAARVVVAPSALPGGVRLCVGRRTQPDDLLLAKTVDEQQGPAGLYELAKRCETVWRIERSGEDDRTSLLLAAVFASTMLGPILTKKSLFGVRTARKMLEAPPAS